MTRKKVKTATPMANGARSSVYTYRSSVRVIAVSLYDSLLDGSAMRARWILVLLVVVGHGAALAVGQAADRLDRFRELAAARLAPLELAGDRPGGPWAAEIYAVVDDEVLDNLAAGGPFASPEFIQERLDAFMGAWGGARLRIVPMADGGRRAGFLAGVFTLSGAAGEGSVRLYARTPEGPALVRTISHAGVPELHGWPLARDGSPQFVVSWLGEASGRGSRALRVQAWRQRGGHTVALVWSTADAFPDGLWVSQWSVGSGEVLVRYELRYAGWKPGCEGQTEHEDLYRYVADRDTVALARRRVVNAWHRELSTAVARLLEALGRGDRRTVAELVPDASLRARLPSRLVAEPACEAPHPERPGTVVVAATQARREGDHPRNRPWWLAWSREPRGWRLTGAGPVLQ